MADLQQFLDEHLKRVRLQKLSDGEEPESRPMEEERPEEMEEEFGEQIDYDIR